MANDGGVTPDSLPDVPIATYRLQLHREFGFESACKVVPYLKGLGVSHLYLSPIWAAAPGSAHGYDVTDHARVNEELGGLAGFYELCRTIRDYGMGIILDIVPNHVGIANHPWWRDVLRYGPQSQFAAYFDIDWEGQPQQETGVLVYPVLGRPLGVALEAGELQLDYDGGEIVVRYFDHTFPVTPRCYRTLLGLPPTAAVAQNGNVVAVLDGLSTAGPQAAELLLHQLSQYIESGPLLASWVEDRLATLNGHPGNPESFDGLEALLRQQHYRLAYWRVSAEEINYRRFFDVNSLAAIRVEHEPVFQATHSLVRDLVASGMVDGLRVDHVDGLYDPGDYLQRLRTLSETAGQPGKGIWVEKVLARGETLPSHWPVEGSTGYNFLAMAGGLFVDTAAEQPLSAIYREFTGETATFADLAFAAKRRIAGRSFAGEVTVLALQLYRLAQNRRLARDNTLGSLQGAIATLLSCMPVYRTYLEDGEPMAADAGMIRAAADEALRRDPNVTPEAIAFLVQVLQLEVQEGGPEEQMRWVHFRRRFQQLSGPVMAKGVEDTAFFRFPRLLACNEVGDDPAHFGVSAADAHQWFGERAATWPRAMSATTTHDTKRSEDARMRLAALSTAPRAWHRELGAWRRRNLRYQSTIQGQDTPDAITEYYLYQTLIASWDGLPDRAYVERIEAHMIKSAREAKRQTNWTSINEPYEAALRAFVRSILLGRRASAFVHRVNDFVASIEPIARLNALGLLTLKATAPGIPDFYQGSEFPLHTLTDPDNRRDIDFARSDELFRAATSVRPDAGDPAAKTWLTHRLLQLRGAYPPLFNEGGYRPVSATGPLAARFFAFERHRLPERVITILPHRPVDLSDAGGALASAGLAETVFELPAARAWIDWISGRRFAGDSPVSASALFAEFPVCVLVSEQDGDQSVG